MKKSGHNCLAELRKALAKQQQESNAKIRERKKETFSIFHAHGMIFYMRFRYFVLTENS